MTDHTRRPPGGPAEKLRVLRARNLFGDLAGRLQDPERARRLEADLNDAWLRLQFALVADDPILEQAQRRACESLLGEALRRGADRGPDPG